MSNVIIERIDVKVATSTKADVGVLYYGATDPLKHTKYITLSEQFNYDDLDDVIPVFEADTGDTVVNV